MRNPGMVRSRAASIASSDRLLMWNRRLLIVAAVFTLWAASVVALQSASADQRAMLASQGMLDFPSGL